MAARRTLLERIFPQWSVAVRAAEPSGILPPSRAQSSATVSTDEAVSLIAVYRALDILTVAAMQLSLDSERNGLRLEGSDVPSIIRKPCLTMSRAEFVIQLVLSLATTGNGYARKVYGPDGAAGGALDLDLWHPHEVGIDQDRDTGRITYHYRGRKYSPADVLHVTKLRLPGKLKGLGPIQAARAELRGSITTRDYATGFFDGTGAPSGVLTSDQALTAADAKTARDVWNEVDADGNPLPPAANPSRIKVLGKGLAYKDTLLSPADAQWLEARQFNTTDVSRLFGVPASLMLAEVPGKSQAYSNVEQDWIAFTRFTLMGYLRPIEDALTDLIPRGQRARFNVEGLLRSDTKTRYEAHKLGIDAGWLLPNEARAIEGLPPLTPAKLAANKPAPAPTPGATSGN